MNRILQAVIAASILFVVSTACTKKEEPADPLKNAANQAANAAGAALTEQKAKMLETLKNKQQNVTKQIGELKAKLANATPDIKMLIEKQIGELEQMVATIGNRIAKTASDTGAGWQDMVKGIEASFGDLEKKLADVSSKVK